MTQIISRRLDRTLRRTLLALPVLAVLILGFWAYYIRTDSYWGVGRTVEQPIGFRHDLHVKQLGLDCAFCHQGVATGRQAGMPAAETCLTCHEDLWRGTRALEPLLTSVELNQPIRWESLYRLPEHSRFNHAAHVTAGVECATCHGDVSEMIKTTKAEPMSMAWCLSCHEMEAERHAERVAASREGMTAANPRLTDCATCHY